MSGMYDEKETKKNYNNKGNLLEQGTNEDRRTH